MLTDLQIAELTEAFWYVAALSFGLGIISTLMVANLVGEVRHLIRIRRRRNV